MDQGIIKIKSSFLFLQWVFFIFKPTISIDGGESKKLGWGESSHTVTAGEHSVHIEIPYVVAKIAKATQTVTVPAGGEVSLTYKPPLIVFMSGKLKVV